jgi:hypothetical protein
LYKDYCLGSNLISKQANLVNHQIAEKIVKIVVALFNLMTTFGLSPRERQRKMSEKDTTRVQVSAEDLMVDEGDWKAFDNLSDEEVLALAESDPDAPPTSVAELQKFQRVVDAKSSS